MFVIRWKHAAFVGFTVALLTVGGTTGNPVPAPKEPSPEEVAKLKALLKERVEVLQEALRITQAEYKAGRNTLENVHESWHELFKTELELCETPVERIAVHQKILAIAQEIEKMTQEQWDAGRNTKGALLRSKAARLDVEIGLLREQMKIKTGSK
jgi:outer membrane protein TolC